MKWSLYDDSSASLRCRPVQPVGFLLLCITSVLKACAGLVSRAVLALPLIRFYLYCCFALSLLSGSSSFLRFTFSLHISVRLHHFLYLSLSVFIT